MGPAGLESSISLRRVGTAWPEPPGQRARAVAEQPSAAEQQAGAPRAEVVPFLAAEPVGRPVPGVAGPCAAAALAGEPYAAAERLAEALRAGAVQLSVVQPAAAVPADAPAAAEPDAA
jgi:hypothetical protein